MFTFLQNSSDIKKALENRRNQLNEGEGGGTPLIIVQSPSLERVESIYVSIAKLRYKVDTIAEAVDLFFKSFHVFHLKYPGPSAHIWIVLQRAIYDFSTEWDFTVQHSWIKCYK